VLVIEQRPPAGQALRVETISFKSRYLRPLTREPLLAQINVDAQATLDYYGGKLDIRRTSLKGRVEVQHVRLVYQGGKLLPEKLDELKAAVNQVKAEVKGAEVLFQ
jgi:hypothetical protein